jgi:hypothetical protein
LPLIKKGINLRLIDAQIIIGDFPGRSFFSGIMIEPEKTKVIVVSSTTGFNASSL